MTIKYRKGIVKISIANEGTINLYGSKLGKLVNVAAIAIKVMQSIIPSLFGNLSLRSSPLLFINTPLAEYVTLLNLENIYGTRVIEPIIKSALFACPAKNRDKITLPKVAIFQILSLVSSMISLLSRSTVDKFYSLILAYLAYASKELPQFRMVLSLEKQKYGKMLINDRLWHQTLFSCHKTLQ